MADFFSELQEAGENFIDILIGTDASENLTFDCKLKGNSQSPKLDRDDRKNLAKAVCAFANSDGGMLLWGVDARERGGVDRLIDKKPIANIKAFANEVERAIPALISPQISGLEFHVIDSGTVAEGGFLAVRVPLSERRPHMSQCNSAPGFYYRKGHTSEPMEVFQVREQMLRRTVPQLEFEWDMRTTGRQFVVEPPNQTARYLLDLRLRNASPVSAQYPYLIASVDLNRYVGVRGD
jgi:predicted HTH transcriptional regulator